MILFPIKIIPFPDSFLRKKLKLNYRDLIGDFLEFYCDSSSTKSNLVDSFLRARRIDGLFLCFYFVQTIGWCYSLWEWGIISLYAALSLWMKTKSIIYHCIFFFFFLFYYFYYLFYFIFILFYWYRHILFLKIYYLFI